MELDEKHKIEIRMHLVEHVMRSEDMRKEPDKVVDAATRLYAFVIGTQDCSQSAPSTPGAFQDAQPDLDTAHQQNPLDITSSQEEVSIDSQD